MVTMQEASKTLLAALEDNWALTPKATKKVSISFRRGEPFDLTTRFTKNKISIEVGKLTRPITKRTLARSVSNEVLPISVWLLVRPKTESQKNSLLDRRQTLEDEIERILLATQKTLADVRFSKVGNVRYIDLLDDDPPTLRVVIDTVCTYNK